LICLILEVHVRTADGEKDHLECDLISEDDGAMVHGLQITLPNHIVEDNQKALHHGEWFVRISGAKVEETLIEDYGTLRTGVFVPQDAQIVTIPPEEGDLYMHAVHGGRSSRYLVEDRSLSNKQVRKVLVVRVSTSNAAPTYSAAELQQYYFSLSSYSLTRQYALCSSSWVWFEGYNQPYSSVVDIYVPGNVGSFSYQTLWAAALVTLLNQLRITSVTQVTDHVAFVLPTGVQGGVWYGVGTVGSWRLVWVSTDECSIYCS
jgi:hypothetical protein